MPASRAEPGRRRARGDGALAEGPLRALRGRRRPAAAPGDARGEPATPCGPAAANLRQHIEIVRSFGSRRWSRSTRSPTDSDPSTRPSGSREPRPGRVAVSTHVVDGGEGAEELAEAVAEACRGAERLPAPYALEDALREKIEAVATRIYGADGIDFAAGGGQDLERFEELGYGRFPVVIAKTHLSLSSDPTLLGAPTGWRMPVREVRAAAGAGYVYAICGDMRTMPGLAGTRPPTDRHRRGRRTSPGSSEPHARLAQGRRPGWRQPTGRPIPDGGRHVSDGSTPSGAPPQGWYPDPQGTTRWWDGSAWTAHVAPASAPAAPTAPTAPVPAPAAPVAAAAAPVPAPVAAPSSTRTATILATEPVPDMAGAPAACCRRVPSRPAAGWPASAA